MQTLVAAIDWEKLIPLAVELITMVLNKNVDWSRLIEIVLAIVQMLFAAQEMSGQAINWEFIIKLILQLISLIGK